MKDLNRALEGLPETITVSLAPLLSQVQAGAMEERAFWESRKHILAGMKVADPLETEDLAWLKELPFSVAYPMKYALDEQQSWHARLANLTFAAYQAARLTGLVLLADYLEVEEHEPQLDLRIRGLQMPHWFEWYALNNKLAKFWLRRTPIKPTRTSRFPGLVENWIAVAKKWDGEPIQAPSNSASQASNPFEAIWKLRNDVAHRSGTHINNDPGTIEQVERFTPITHAMLERLFRGNVLELWGKVEDIGVTKLHGPGLEFEAQPPPRDVITKALEQYEVIATCQGYAHALPVFPFCVTEGECGEGASIIDPVIMLDQVRKEHIVLQGVLEHHESSALVGPLLNALRKKKVALIGAREDCKRDVFVGYAGVTTENTFERLLNRKYFPKFYQTRANVDDVLEAWLERGQRPLLVQGEAGSGKSSLLLHHARKRGADDANRVVFLLSGREDLTPSSRAENPLLDILEAASSFERGTFVSVEALTVFLSEFATTHKLEILFVLDAINESGRPEALLRAIDDNLSFFQDSPVRLMMSLRPERHLASPDEVPALTLSANGMVSEQKVQVPLRNKQHLHAVEGEACLELLPMSEDEVRSAYIGRQTSGPERACTTPEGELSHRLLDVLRRPFYHHIFHELHAGKDATSSIYNERRLLECYVDDLEKRYPRLVDLFEEVARGMISNRMPLLREDQVHALNERTHGDVSSMFAASAVELLTRSSETMHMSWRQGDFSGLLFNHQLVCEILLERFIQDHNKHSGDVALACWLEHTRTEDGQLFEELVNALDHSCCAHLRGDTNLDALAPAITWEDDEVRGQIVRSLFIELILDFTDDSSSSWRRLETFEQFTRDAGKWLTFVHDLLSLDQDVWMIVEVPGLRDRVRTYLFDGLEEMRGEEGDSLELSRAMMKLGVQTTESLFYSGAVEEGLVTSSKTIDAARAVLALEEDESQLAREARFYSSLAHEMHGQLLQTRGQFARASSHCESARQGYGTLLEDPVFGAPSRLRSALLEFNWLAIMGITGSTNDELLAARQECLASLEHVLATAEEDYKGHLLHIWALHVNGCIDERQVAGFDADETSRYLHAAIVRVKAQLEIEPWQLNLRSALARLLETAARLSKQPEESLSFAEEAVVHAHELAAREGDSRYYTLYASRSLGALAERQSHFGRIEEARASFWQATHLIEKLHEGLPDHIQFSREMFDLFFAFASDKKMFPEQEERLALIERGALTMLPHWEALTEDLDMLRELTLAFNRAGVTHRHLGDRESARLWLRYDLEASKQIVELDNRPKRIIDLVYAQIAYQSVLDDMEKRHALLEAAREQMSALHAMGVEGIREDSWEAVCDAFAERALEADFMSEEELAMLGWGAEK